MGPVAANALIRSASELQLPLRYNVAPTQLVPVVRQTDSGREFSTMRWGLVPSWADDPKIGYKMINARSEDAATKPSFRSAMMATSLRCEALVHNFAGGTPALINNEPRITDINSTNTSSQKNGRHHLIIPVLLLRESMPFIFGHQIPHRRPMGPDGLHHLH